MKASRVSLGLAMALFLAVLPAARGARDVDADPSVRLYINRIEALKSQKSRQAIRTDYLRRRYERMKRLIASNAVSQEEFEMTSANYDMNRTLLGEADVRLREAEILLELARTRVAEGKEMPIIPLDTIDGIYVH